MSAVGGERTLLLTLTVVAMTIMLDAKRLLAALVLVALSNCAAPPKDKYAGRDGRQEAANDLKAGKPIAIYSHVFDGFAPGLVSPGLIDCSPDQARDNTTRRLFRFMPEATFQEGQTRRPVDSELAMSAVNFARSYNQEVLRLRRADVEKVCPHVRHYP